MEQRKLKQAGEKIAPSWVPNGLINVPEIDLKYRGYHIVPKRDFGGHAYMSHGCIIRKGYVVTDGTCNVMPGGTWFWSVIEAKAAVDILLYAEKNGYDFWKLWDMACGRDIYEEV